MAVLDIQGLSAGYRENDVLLREVNLRVHKHEIVCVIGESGCGKSTLINAILQMPNSVKISEGKILFDGRNLLELNQKNMRLLRGAKIGMVYQEPGASFNPIRKIGIQFHEMMRAHVKITRRQSYDIAEELFSKFGLPDPKRVLNSFPIQLSGGMNQRVAIAMAVALHPQILLADEPSSALDVMIQNQIIDELIQIRDEFGLGILLVTHNIGVVNRIADNVAVMYRGEILEFGSRDDILKRPSHSYTQALIDAVPKLH